MRVNLQKRASSPILAIILLIPSFHTTSLFGQIVVNTGPTPQQLVQNVLAGQGVDVFNVTFTGESVQIAEFDGTQDSIPFDGGIVMSTGDASDAVGPNDNGTVTTSHYNQLGVNGDPDLLSIAQQTNPNTDSVKDETIIEFDLVPKGDSIAFDFIFGSEEYPEFVYKPGVNTYAFNDVFGFFISGPGINGPYQNNAENLALIPGTTDPISISDVNSTTNALYYEGHGNASSGSHGDGSLAPYNTDPGYYNADGHTVPLIASSPVSCKDTFHLAIKLGDGQDENYDSYVFLRGESLKSKNLFVDSEINTGQSDSALWEGCGELSFDMTRPNGDSGIVDTAFLQTSGTANEGTDYSNLQDTILFPYGKDSVHISLQAFDDGLVEGMEDARVRIIYRDGSACGNTDTSYTDFYIKDPDTLNINTSPDTSLTNCPDSIQLYATASGGFGNYQWTWNKGIPDGDSSGMVLPQDTTTYVVSVSDTCGIGNPSDSIRVNVKTYPPLKVHPFKDTHLVCPDQYVPVGIDSITGGSGNATFEWDSLGTDSSYMVNPSSSRTYQVTTIDTCAFDTARGSLKVTKAFDPLRVSAAKDTSICAGSKGNLRVKQQSGGTGDITYEWEPGSYSEDSLWYQSDKISGTKASTTYTVTATDSCGVTAQDSMKVELSSPIAAFHYTSNTQETGSPIHFISDAQNAFKYRWWFGYEDFSAISQDTVISYPQPGTYEITHAVEDRIGCPDTVRQRIRINPPFAVYVPNAFSPDGDGRNDRFRAEGPGIASFHMKIFDRWGELVFETEDLEKGWDGTIDGDPAPSGVYVYKISAEGENGQNQTVQGHVTLIR